MNLEVPCLAACKRLAKAGYPQAEGLYAYILVSARKGLAPVICDCLHHCVEKHLFQTVNVGFESCTEGLYHAPTIGEMLAYIRRGPYEFRKRVASALVSRPEWSLNGGEERVDDCVLNFLCLVDADALANALAESFEKEGKT